MAGHVLDGLGRQRSANLLDTLSYVRAASPLYRRKLAHLRPDGLRGLEDIASLPYTTRGELLSLAPFGTICDDALPPAYYESTGTSGTFLPGFPDLSAEKARSFGEFLDRWMELRKGRVNRAVVALAFEMNPTGIRFQMALPYAGVTVIPCGVRSTICPPEKTLDLILRLEPQALICRPFEILRYGDALRARGTPPEDTKIIKLFYLGEVMSDGKWARIRELWDGADLYGHYGLTEVDSGLQTCAHGRYHEPSSPFLYTELIDKVTLAPLSPTDHGWGELVLTTLRRSHAPVIRYRTGDIARRVRCACGEPTPAYLIRGRDSDCYRQDGAEAFPIDLENVIYANPDVGNEYLFVIRPDSSLKLLLERAWGSRTEPETIARAVRSALDRELGIVGDVEVRPYGGLADKLGIPVKKSGRFTDLRGLTPAEQNVELQINVVDSDRLRAPSGQLLSI
jgi:phenylacetate-coenzyme A ligase PaaK-like adenylate-forming protein